jgi:hypothetical protein
VVLLDDCVPGHSVTLTDREHAVSRLHGVGRWRRLRRWVGLGPEIAAFEVSFEYRSRGRWPRQDDDRETSGEHVAPLGSTEPAPSATVPPRGRSCRLAVPCGRVLGSLGYRRAQVLESALLVRRSATAVRDGAWRSGRGCLGLDMTLQRRRSRDDALRPVADVEGTIADPRLMRASRDFGPFRARKVGAPSLHGGGRAMPAGGSPVARAARATQHVPVRGEHRTEERCR